MGRIGILAPLPADAVAGQFPEHEVAAVVDLGDPVATVRGADVVLADWTSTHRVAGDVLEALAPTCQLVQVMGAGVDSVDVEGCAAAGVPVASGAGLNAVAVAEWCVWGAIGALRQLSAAETSLREGRWDQLGSARYELAGKTVGLVGMGDIGVACCPRFAAFDVDLRYWTRRRRSPDREAELGVSWSELDDLIRASDVLVFVIALTDETRQLLSADRIATLKPSAVVVNAARGEVVDEGALAEALAQGRLHGAAVDVFSQEPPPPHHPLLSPEPVTVTPHLAGASVEATGRIAQRAFDNVGRALRGEQPEGLVN